MHKVGLSSPSPSGISPEEQVFRKTSSVMRFGNLVLSDRKVTATAERQPSLEWGGGAEASDCKPGDGKISIALNEEPELQWGNSITAPLRWLKPTGDVRPCSTHVPIRWEHPSHSLQSSTALPPSVVVAPKQFADKAQGSLLSLVSLVTAWMCKG